MDMLFLRRALATINCIYIRWIWQIFLFKADFYFKVALAAIHLSSTIIILGSHLQWSSIFKSTVFFFLTNTCIHPVFQKYWVSSQVQLQQYIRWIIFFYYKRVIAATYSFKFTVFLQNRNCSKEILTIIIIFRSQPVFTCSKSTIKTPEQCVKHVQS